MIFDSFGEIYSCLVSVGDKHWSIGSYFPEVKFKEKSLRNRNIETIPKCQKCIYSLLCGGSCPMRLSGDSDVLSPSCDAVHYNVHTLLPKLYQINDEMGV